MQIQDFVEKRWLQINRHNLYRRIYLISVYHLRPLGNCKGLQLFKCPLCLGDRWTGCITYPDKLFRLAPATSALLCRWSLTVVPYSAGLIILGAAWSALGGFVGPIALLERLSGSEECLYFIYTPIGLCGDGRGVAPCKDIFLLCL